MRADAPRVPLPRSSKQFLVSVALGTSLAGLLDPEAPVRGVSIGRLRRGLHVLGLPHRKGGKSLSEQDLILTAGWGHVQTSRAGTMLVMPGTGLVEERDYTAAERAAIEEEAKALGMAVDSTLQLLGRRTFDVHLNADAMWSNVPTNVWNYTLGGYQVIKKWLSYREHSILDRALKPDEVAYVSEMVRRVAAILLLGPVLDANYEASKVDVVEWKDGRPVEKMRTS